MKRHENHLNLTAMVMLALAVTVTGCSSACKIDGCKEKIYKEGLCEDHYSMIHEGEKAIESTEAEKSDETTAPIVEQKLKIPFSGEGATEISEGITPSDYVLPESNIRSYTIDELSSLSAEELRLARNEIYARYGYIFKTSEMSSYFSGKPWYTPRYSLVDSKLNEYDIANRDLIVQIEGGSKPASSNAIDYKGGYVFKGREYIKVKKYYIKDNELYLEGDYCDGVDNPDPQDEGDRIIYNLVYPNVIVRINGNSVISNSIKEYTNNYGNYGDSISLSQNHIDECFKYYGNAILEIELKNDFVTNINSIFCLP